MKSSFRLRHQVFCAVIITALCTPLYAISFNRAEKESTIGSDRKILHVLNRLGRAALQRAEQDSAAVAYWRAISHALETEHKALMAAFVAACGEHHAASISGSKAA